MLILPFSIGDQTYALEAAQVVEVAPRVEIRPLPFAPPSVAGVCNYRGEAVPVVDLAALLVGRPSARKMSTRILFVRGRDRAGDERLIGLLAEGVTEAVRTESRTLAGGESGLLEATGLGPLLAGDRGPVQVVRVERILARVDDPRLPGSSEAPR